MNKVERIRARKSYKMFEEWYNFLPVHTSDTKLILQKLRTELDNHSAYGTQTMADYAKESLDQLCKDKNIK